MSTKATRDHLPSSYSHLRVTGFSGDDARHMSEHRFNAPEAARCEGGLPMAGG